MHYQDMPGGAVIIYELLKELAGDRVQFGLAQKTKEALRRWPRQFQTCATWHLVANGKEPTDGRHWALKQQLGYGEAEPKPYPATTAPGLPKAPEILVIDDGGLGFRDAAKNWPACLRGGARPKGLEWVILKMSRPLAAGRLWEKLKTAKWNDRLVLIINTEQLRAEGLRAYA